MIKIMKNEFYKFFKSRKNLVVISLMFIYIIGINFYNINQGSEYLSKMRSRYGGRSRQASAYLTQQTLILDKNEDLTEEEKTQMKKEIEFYTVEKNKLAVMENIYKENNPEKYYHKVISEVDRYKNILDNINSGVIEEKYLTQQNIDLKEIEKIMLFNNYILENDIDYMLNIYEPTGANYLGLFLNGTNLLILMFLISLLVIDIYLSEVEEGSYKLAYTQPFGRSKIFLGKILTIVLVSILLFTLLAIMNYGVLTLIYGKGDFSYPYLSNLNLTKLGLNSSNIEYTIIPLWKYLIYGFSLFIPILFFQIFFIIATSILTDSTTKTLGFSLILLAFAYIINSFVYSNSIVHLIYPYSYLYVEDVINLNNSSNYMFGILINVVLSIGLFALSYIMFLKKNFLGAKE